VCRIERQRLTSHDVITISDETEADGQGDDSDLPQGYRSLGTNSLASGPSRVHSSPDTNSVTDVVSTVCEGGGAGGDDLHEGVKVFNLVRVLRSVRVYTFHTATLGSSEDTDLRAVDIVRHAVEGSDDDLGGNTDKGSLHVVKLVDGACSELVVVQSSHSPAQWGLLLSQLGVVLLTGVGQQDTVGFARVLVFLNGRGPLLRGSIDVDG
jgi:hypothetical protein